MKEFDLEYAQKGAAVCTRDGRKARIICYDRKGKNYTLIVLVMETYAEEYYSYTEQGTFEVDENTKLDLMMRDDDYKERLDSRNNKGFNLSIYKFNIPIVPDLPYCPVRMPIGSKIISAQLQDSELCLWARVNPDAELGLRGIRLVPTGEKIPAEWFDTVEFIDTIQIDDIGIVLHVYAEKE